MPTPTEIYLTDQQRRRIDELAAAQGVTMAEVICHALDTYLDEQADPAAALAVTFGSAPELEIPSRDW